MRLNPPSEWPPSEQILWFGIFRLEDEFPNQSSSSQAMITFPLRVNMFCITVGLVFNLQLFQMSLALEVMDYLASRLSGLNFSNKARNFKPEFPLVGYDILFSKNQYVFYMMRLNPPTEWPPSGQVVWFGIFRLKDEIANQSSRS